jgi:hypothetical protein
VPGRRILLGLLLLAANPACGGPGTAGAVRPHSPMNERAVRAPRAVQPPPRLIAPPPAYGNKIVLAKREPKLAVN